MIHIHNGDVVAVHAKRVGVPGDHVSFRECLIAGPVQPGDNWIESRARFLASAYGDDLLRVSNRLFEQEQTIAASGNADEIVLWFEHDLFCLIHFIYLLQRLPVGRTSIVWHDQPLGNVEADDLLRLFNRRRPATREMVALSRETWQAYVAPDPTALNPLIVGSASEFPFLRDGLALHLARFPAVRNGLGVIEQRILEFIADGANDFKTLFNRFWLSQPRFGLSDSEVLRQIHGLAGRTYPLITLTEGSEQAVFTITEVGERVLAGTDDIELNGIDMWLGGVHLTKERMWRWDVARNAVIPNQSQGS
jgi:hypothetical protein